MEPIKLPPLILPAVQKQSMEALEKIGKHLTNFHPELIIKHLEVKQNKDALKPEKVHAPVLSLKALVSAQKEAFAAKFIPLVNQKPNGDASEAPEPQSNRLPIAIPETIHTDTAYAEELKSISPLHVPATVFEFDQSQEDARKGILQEQFSCLIGPAGTGKTKTLNDILEDLKEELGLVTFKEKQKDGSIKLVQKLSIVFCSFTGRAVEQMKSKLPKEYHNVCGTIHGDKVLAYVPEYYEDMDEEGFWKTKVRFVPTYDAQNKLPYDVYVIDETGMLSVDLWNTLREAMLPNAKVILVGDINQLPPVYGRSILGYAMTQWPVFELTKIHRQAADNPIIANAHRILNGTPPLAVKGKFDLDDLGGMGSNGAQDRIIKVLRFLQKKNEFDVMNDGCIVPHNVGPLGKDQLNELILPFFNPATKETPRTLIRTGIATIHFQVNDKVMMLNNDKYNNLTNGQIGRIVSISLNGKYQNIAGMVKQSDLEVHKNIHIHDADNFELEVTDEDRTYNTEGAKEENSLSQRQASHIVTVDFGTADNSVEVTFSTAGEFRAIAHAYVITCHKSQGGEYPTVVILVHSANNVSFSREWLYTAVTRARERIVLVFNQRGLMQCLNRQRVKGRTLQEKIASFLKISEEDAGKEKPIIPNLPKARKMREEVGD